MMNDGAESPWNPECVVGGLFRRWMCVVAGDDAYRETVGRHGDKGDEHDRRTAARFASCLRSLGSNRMSDVIDVINAAITAHVPEAPVTKVDMRSDNPYAARLRRFMPRCGRSDDRGDPTAVWLLGLALGRRDLRTAESETLVRRGPDWMTDMLGTLFIRMADADAWSRARTRHQGRLWMGNMIHAAMIMAEDDEILDPVAFGDAVADTCVAMMDDGFDEVRTMAVFEGDYRLFLRWSDMVAAHPDAPACASTVGAMYWLFHDASVIPSDATHPMVSSIVSAMESDAEPDYSAFREWMRGMISFMHPMRIDYRHGTGGVPRLVDAANRSGIVGLDALGRMRSPGRVLGVLYAYDMLITADGTDPANPADYRREVPDGDGRDVGYRSDAVRRGLRMLERGMPMDMAAEIVLMNDRDRGDGPQ